MMAVDPVSLRDIPQYFTKLYLQHELLSSRSRQQGMSYIIENYIQDASVEKVTRKQTKGADHQWSVTSVDVTVANENLKNPTLFPTPK